MTGLIRLFQGCPKLAANTIHRPLTCPLNPKWPEILAKRCGNDVLEMDLTYQISRTFKSRKQVVTLRDMYDTEEGEETRTLGIEEAKKRRGRCFVSLDTE